MVCFYLIARITSYAEFEIAVFSLPVGFDFCINLQRTEARTGASCLAFQWQILSAMCATFGPSTLRYLCRCLLTMQSCCVRSGLRRAKESVLRIAASKQADRVRRKCKMTMFICASAINTSHSDQQFAQSSLMH